MTLNVQGFVRFPLPTDTWIKNEPPAGYQLLVVDDARRDTGWRVGGGGKLCRFTTGPGHRTCRRPAVATLDRGWARRNRWGYCELHLYGRHLENGKLLTTIWRPIREKAMFR